MAELFTNGASALLAASITPISTVVQVENGKGTQFASPGGGDFQRLVIEDASANIEVVFLTARTGDLLTVTRAQEGTTALSFTSGLARIEARPTKGMFEAFLQKGGGTMTGALNMGGQNVTNAVMQAPTIVGGTARGTALRASDNNPANEISVPNGGGSPTVGGSAIWHSGNFNPSALFTAGMILMWYGASNNVPSGWKICDGTNGTPDLRNRFVIGAGGTYNLNATGGSTTVAGTVSSGGAHAHGAATGSTALTEAQMPAHTHTLLGANNASSSNADGWTKTANMGVPGEDVGPFTALATNGAGTPLVGSTGSGAGHTHSISSDGTHDHTFSVSSLPPFTALFYIMKV